ncbi:fumarylacetoacetate hydrolase family protein [Nocardioides sp.]|uniref:fumarylacetoacetate hydrolase family protein n=1 Tax=Nocardioides sp. TaxID=35761 RepID=UPI0031FE5B5B|nr:2-keto-4-pentenoate hydratase/2-oxohepta-3-ene,7-dioic acid hydratase [Nocardioides sp.]
MRIARVQPPDADRPALVRLEGETAVVLAHESDHVAADVLQEALHAGVDLNGSGLGSLTAQQLRFLTPVRRPGRILCAALNYGAHAAETGRAAPAEPMLFAKFSGSLVDPDGYIEVADSGLGELDYEGELAVVIGKQCRRVTHEAALSHVLGYTIANDVSARTQQRNDGQWWRAKGSDGFAPLGPVIVTSDELGDASGLTLITTVNSEQRQEGSTSDLIFSVPELLVHVSRFITLEPGDVLLTGTPPGVGVAMNPPSFLRDGDQVEVTIDRIGTLRSTVRLRHG